MSSLVYFFKESIIGFTRNVSTTLGSIITIFLSLLIIGVFAVGGVIVNNVVAEIEDKVSISVWLSDDAEDEQVQKLQSFIQGLESVNTVSFISKDQALENFTNSMTSNPEIIDQLDGMNPLPASLTVELTDPQQIGTVAAAIESNDVFLSICEKPDKPEDSIKWGSETVDKLFSLTNYIRYIGVALIALLVFIALVFINNTIRLAILARRKEIAIMRLVGASNGFIRGPFLMEGFLHATIGALLAILVIEILRRVALPMVSSALTWLPIDLGPQAYFLIYGALLVAGLIIGLIGSMLAMRRYLKV